MGAAFVVALLLLAFPVLLVCFGVGDSTDGAVDAGGDDEYESCAYT